MFELHCSIQSAILGVQCSAESVIGPLRKLSKFEGHACVSFIFFSNKNNNFLDKIKILKEEISQRKW